MQRRRAHSSWRPIPELVWKPFLERAGPSIPLAADIEVSRPLNFRMDHPEDVNLYGLAQGGGSILEYVGLALV